MNQYYGIPDHLYGPSSISRKVKGSVQCRGLGENGEMCLVLGRKPETHVNGQAPEGRKAKKLILPKKLQKQ